MKLLPMIGVGYIMSKHEQELLEAEDKAEAKLREAWKTTKAAGYVTQEHIDARANWLEKVSDYYNNRAFEKIVGVCDE
jgi:hypothetical protein